MRLDGQRKVDRDKLRDGVEKTYTFPDGYGPGGGPARLTMKYRCASIGNVAFQAALAELVVRRPEVADKRANLRQMMDDSDVMGLIYDHVVLSWSTDLQVGGENLEATRDNWIALMRYTAEWSEEIDAAGLFAPEVAVVTISMLADLFDSATFYAERKAHVRGN